MNASNVWDLIHQGRFGEACILADTEFQETESLLVLRIKIFALLQLGRLDESIAMSEKIIGLTNRNTDSDFIFFGVARWLQGQTDAAVAAWRSGLTSTYTDAAGGVEIRLLLLFAAISNHDSSLEKEALGKLELAGKSKRISDWPGPIVSYMLGVLSEEALISKISKQPILRKKQECQSDFYIAVKRLKSRDWIGYKAKLQGCLSHGPASYVKHEFYLAKAELSRLN
jgi:hypothetical protein